MPREEEEVMALDESFNTRLERALAQVTECMRVLWTSFVWFWLWLCSRSSCSVFSLIELSNSLFLHSVLFIPVCRRPMARWAWNPLAPFLGLRYKSRKPTKMDICLTTTNFNNYSIKSFRRNRSAGKLLGRVWCLNSVRLVPFHSHPLLPPLLPPPIFLRFFLQARSYHYTCRG